MVNVNSLPRGDILAFDFGLKRIGVAYSHSDFDVITPLKTLRNFKEVENVVKYWRPCILITGYSFRMDGSKNHVSDLCMKFALDLKEKFNLPVVLIDELLSSAVAESKLKEMGVPLKKKGLMLDNLAAAELILCFKSQKYSRALV